MRVIKSIMISDKTYDQLEKITVEYTHDTGCSSNITDMLEKIVDYMYNEIIN